MSEFTDDIVSRYLNQNPEQRKAYATNPQTHHEVNLLRRMLETAERAMKREGVPVESMRHVLNEIVYGEPEPRLTRDEARHLLLTRFDPSASDVTINQLFTELAEGSPVRDDVTPERMDAWLEKQQARLKETTGFDLSPAERPTASEETSG